MSISNIGLRSARKLESRKAKVEKERGRFGFRNTDCEVFAENLRKRNTDSADSGMGLRAQISAFQLSAFTFGLRQAAARGQHPCFKGETR